MSVSYQALGLYGQVLGASYAIFGGVLVLASLTRTYGVRLLAVASLFFGGFIVAVTYTISHDMSASEAASDKLYQKLILLLLVVGAITLVKALAIIVRRKHSPRTGIRFVGHLFCVAGLTLLASILWLLLDERVMSRPTYDADALWVLQHAEHIMAALIVLTIVALVYDKVSPGGNKSAGEKPFLPKKTVVDDLSDPEIRVIPWGPGSKRQR